MNDPDIEVLGGALGRRTRAVADAVRRMDGLVENGADPDPVEVTETDIREVVLRALRATGDVAGERILRAVANGTTEVADLAVLTGRTRLALWEAVGDFVQVGLLERRTTCDAVALTGAGHAMLALVDALIEAAEKP